uniref:Transposon protein, putative, CACTA, En/Spm sub-class n=1 Tax=Oryza sativa subsp. japonica TaxID=39947 RepID=Q2R2K3_ORYSJ|nr:transposon protein, putative, CACTA, En/Spm sub-class [Oryza sativa Japonica Group]
MALRRDEVKASWAGGLDDSVRAPSSGTPVATSKVRTPDVLATSYTSTDPLICDGPSYAWTTDCRNEILWEDEKEVHAHLIRRGFMERYTRWVMHGEQDLGTDGAATDGSGVDNHEEGDEEEHDMFVPSPLGSEMVDVYPDMLQDMLCDINDLAMNERDSMKFNRLDMLPQENTLPETTYEAKQVLCPLGLEVRRIHACPNDCILYHKQYVDLDACPVCKASRYKRKKSAGKRKKSKRGGPAKVVWYLPIIDRFKRIFANPNEAKLVRWHATEKRNDDLLRHPADSIQWRNIDRKHKDFAADPRNMRICLCTDGMNPFGDMSSSHSTWPVLIANFNLPPWLCFKRKYIMLCLLIQGPRQPGNDIDVFLKPVIDDLEILWKEGVETWDAYGQENFTLRVLLFCTINDYPALGNLSGQTVKGKKACSDCMEHTRSRWLKKSRKMVYMGHRRWLPLRHTFRRKKKIFNGKKELGSAPADLSGDQEMNIRNELHPVTDENTGRVYLPPACHILLKDEKIAMLSCLADIKVPSGYCARINVFSTSFLRYHGSSHCSPSEANKNMWASFYERNVAIERYMGILKSYVRNRAKPEGSIIEGYTTEEAIEFCIDYMAETDPIGVPTSRHEERLAGVGTTGRKRIVPDQASYAQAHFAVLQHMVEVTPYFEEHLAKVRQDNIDRSDIWINREHGARFNEWFKDRVARSIDGPSEILQRLARGPSWDVDTWQGYDINGYTFYTVTHDEKSTVQNSGVRIDAYQDQVGSSTYYGRIEQIWELNYLNFKVPLFRCSWVNIRTGVKVDKEGFTLVDLAKVGYADEPFILAKQDEQIFYIKDLANKKMHVVRDGKRGIVGVDNVVDEEEYNKNLHVRPHIDLDDDPEDKVAYVRSDHLEGISL